MVEIIVINGGEDPTEYRPRTGSGNNLSPMDREYQNAFTRLEEERQRLERGQQKLAEARVEFERSKRKTPSPTAQRYQDYTRWRREAAISGRALTPAENDVCFLFVVYVRPNQGIAEDLGLPHGSVRTHKTKGAGKLRFRKGAQGWSYAPDSADMQQSGEVVARSYMPGASADGEKDLRSMVLRAAMLGTLFADDMTLGDVMPDRPNYDVLLDAIHHQYRLASPNEEELPDIFDAWIEATIALDDALIDLLPEDGFGQAVLDRSDTRAEEERIGVALEAVRGLLKFWEDYEEIMPQEERQVYNRVEQLLARRQTALKQINSPQP
jgi:hypothetical protein